MPESQEHYRHLWQQLAQGVSYFRMLGDGPPHDFVYLEVNEAFERLTGLKSVTGKKLSEVIPNFFETDAEELEIYRQVASTGQPRHFERYQQALGKWISVSASSPQQDHVLAIIQVSDQTQLTQALSESRALSSSVISAMAEGVFVLDAQGHIVASNSIGERILGCSREETIGRTTYDFRVIHEDGSPFPGEEHPAMQVLRTGRPITDEVMGVYRPDDSLVWISVNAGPISYGEGNQSQAVVTTFTDITARKRAEAEREQYFNLFQVSADLMVIADPNGAFLKTNPSCTRLLGYSEAELVSKPFIDFVHPDDKQSTLDEMARQIESGFSIDFENRYMCKDGALRWLSWHAHYNKADGTTYATARDITERRLAVDSLRKSEARFRTLFESLHAIVLLVDPEDGSIVDVNQAAVAFYGYDRAALRSMNLAELNFSSREELLRELRAQKTVRVCRNRRADGSLRAVEVSSSPVEIEGRRLLFKIVYDITEKERAAELLRERELLLTSVVEGIPDYVMRYDRAGRHLFVNSRVGRDAGISPTSFIGKTHRELGFSEEESAFYESAIATAFWTRETQQRVFEWESVHGKKYLEWRVIPELGPDGSCQTVLGLSRDITESKRAEAILARQAEVSAALAGLSRALIATTSGIETILERTLAAARALTGSTQGYVSYIDPATGNNVSLIPPETTLTQEADGTYPGLWGHALNTRQGFFTNAAASHQATREMPEPPAGIERFLSVPVLEGQALVGQIALVNPPWDYGDEHLAVVEQIGFVYGLALRRWRAEEALRESERDLRRSQEVAHVGSWAWDARTNRVTWSEEMKRIWGLDPAHYGGDTAAIIRQAVHPDDQARVMEGAERALREGVAPEAEYRIVWPDGSIRHLWVLPGDRTADSEGRLVRLTGIVQDITERARAQELLQRERSRYRSLMTIAQDGIHVLDAGGGLVEASDSFLRMLGYGREAVGKLNLRDWEAGVPPQEIQATLHEVLERPRLFQTRLRRQDGSELDVEVHAGPVELDGGLFILASSRDISARKQFERALASNQSQLEELNRSLEERVQAGVAELRHKDQMIITQSRQAAMGEMIGHIAHQWRQPLSALGIVLANLRDAWRFGQLDGPTMDKAVEDADFLIQEMSTTINDFRDFFKPDKARTSFSALAQIREAVRLAEASYRHADIRVEIESGADVTVFGVPSEYSQVVLNLLSNAKQAIEHSKVDQGLVRLRVDQGDGFGRLAVIDNGGGIPTALLDKVFEPYFSTRVGGTGIGLFLSRQIIERSFGGRLEARNVEGGAELTVLTPLPDSDHT